MKPTVTNNNIRYGLFRADAELFTDDHCLRGITYTDLKSANAARLEMRKQVPVAERKLIVVHEIDENKIGSSYAVEE